MSWNHDYLLTPSDPPDLASIPPDFLGATQRLVQSGASLSVRPDGSDTLLGTKSWRILAQPGLGIAAKSD